MSVANGQNANQTTINAAFVSKTVNSTTVGQVSLANVDSSSGSSITNIQRELNSLAVFMGKSTNIAANARPTWVSNTTGASGDDIFTRADELTIKFDTHTHSGAPGQGAQINLATSVAGVLPIANGSLFVNTTEDQSVSGVKQFDKVIRLARTVDDRDDLESATLPVNTGHYILAGSGVMSISGVSTSSTEDSGFFILTNRTGGAVTIFNDDGGTGVVGVKTGTGSSIELEDEASLFLILDEDEGTYYVVGGSGSGGSSAPEISNFTTGTIICSDKFDQVFRHTGTAPLTLSSIVTTLLENGGRITIMALSNDYPVTIPSTLVGVQNGDAVLNVGGTITYIKDSTLGLVEVSRNGL